MTDKLLPREPTEEMIEAAIRRPEGGDYPEDSADLRDALRGAYRRGAIATWRTMWDAGDASTDEVAGEGLIPISTDGKTIFVDGLGDVPICWRCRAIELWAYKYGRRFGIFVGRAVYWLAGA